MGPVNSKIVFCMCLHSSICVCQFVCTVHARVQASKALDFQLKEVRQLVYSTLPTWCLLGEVKRCSSLGAIQVLRNAIFLEIGPPPTPS